jgi:hypothetical protein
MAHRLDIILWSQSFDLIWERRNPQEEHGRDAKSPLEAKQSEMRHQLQGIYSNQNWMYSCVQ